MRFTIEQHEMSTVIKQWRNALYEHL